MSATSSQVFSDNTSIEPPSTAQDDPAIDANDPLSQNVKVGSDTKCSMLSCKSPSDGIDCPTLFVSSASVNKSNISQTLSSSFSSSSSSSSSNCLPFEELQNDPIIDISNHSTTSSRSTSPVKNYRNHTASSNSSQPYHSISLSRMSKHFPLAGNSSNNSLNSNTSSHNSTGTSKTLNSKNNQYTNTDNKNITGIENHKNNNDKMKEINDTNNIDNANEICKINSHSLGDSPGTRISTSSSNVSHSPVHSSFFPSPAPSSLSTFSSDSASFPQTDDSLLVDITKLPIHASLSLSSAPPAPVSRSSLMANIPPMNEVWFDDDDDDDEYDSHDRSSSFPYFHYSHRNSNNYSTSSASRSSSSSIGLGSFGFGSNSAKKSSSSLSHSKHDSESNKLFSYRHRRSKSSNSNNSENALPNNNANSTGLMKKNSIFRYSLQSSSSSSSNSGQDTTNTTTVNTSSATSALHKSVSPKSPQSSNTYFSKPRRLTNEGLLTRSPHLQSPNTPPSATKHKYSASVSAHGHNSPDSPRRSSKILSFIIGRQTKDNSNSNTATIDSNFEPSFASTSNTNNNLRSVNRPTISKPINFVHTTHLDPLKVDSTAIVAKNPKA